MSFVICVRIDVELSAHCGAPHRKRNILWIFCEYSLDIAQDLFTFLLPISTSTHALNSESLIELRDCVLSHDQTGSLPT